MTIFIKLYNIYTFLIKWIISICLSCVNKKVEIYCRDIKTDNFCIHEVERSKNIQDNLSINHIELLKKHCRDKMKSVIKKIRDYEFEKNIRNEKPINPYVAVFENILTYNECKQVISLFKNRNKKIDIKFGKTGNGLNLDKKLLDEICLLSHTDDIRIIRVKKMIINKIRLVLDMYAIECEEKNHNPFIKNILRDKKADLPISIIRCKKYTKHYSYYRWHIDGSMSNGKDSFLSMIFYLNDLGNEGGTCFIDGKVYGKAGRAVVFPALWYMNHRSLCCEDRDKYIINIILDKTK